jgi:hypothetical protein
MAAAFFFSSLALSTPVRAQCGYFGECSGGEHKLPETQQSNKNPHSYCATCVQGVCHPICGGSFVTNPKLKARYEAVLDAANASDVGRVIRLAGDIPGYVLFNSERRSVQILGCSLDAIVANLPIRNERILQLAMRLPSSELTFAVALDRKKSAVGGQ